MKNRTKDARRSRYGEKRLTITIPKKEPNSIHDIADKYEDLNIDMTFYEYVLILSPYYNIHGSRRVFRTRSLNGLKRLIKQHKNSSFKSLNKYGETVAEVESIDNGVGAYIHK